MRYFICHYQNVSPFHDVILTNIEKNMYVPMDLNILQACKNLDELRICKRLQPSYLISETQSCETVIFKASK